MAVTSVEVQVGVRTWDMGIVASIGSLLVLDHFNNGRWLKPTLSMTEQLMELMSSDTTLE